MIVTVEHRKFTSAVHSPSAAVTALIKRSVPSLGREYDPAARVWLIYGSRVEKLVAALRAAGHDVVETPAGGAE